MSLNEELAKQEVGRTMRQLESQRLLDEKRCRAVGMERSIETNACDHCLLRATKYCLARQRINFVAQGNQRALPLGLGFLARRLKRLS